MAISKEENSLLGGVFLQWDANVEGFGLKAGPYLDQDCSVMCASCLLQT